MSYFKKIALCIRSEKSEATPWCCINALANAKEIMPKQGLESIGSGGYWREHKRDGAHCEV